MYEFEVLKHKTNDFVRVWNNCKYFAPKSVTEKYAKTVLDWQSSLTDALEIWKEKGIAMTSGELILANANLGALVECWLVLFLFTYYEDYTKEPRIKKDEVLEPEDFSFEDLKQFFYKKVFTKDNKKEWFEWISKIQYRRNAIHSFKNRDIGSPDEFLSNLNKYCEFVELICDRLPPIEDYCQ